MLRQFANSNWLKQIKQTLSLSDIQKQVLIGTVLGDGSLKISSSGKAARLQICHSASAKQYVLWKQKIFKNWVFNEPTYYKINNSLIFRTVSHPLIFEYMKLFYMGRLKVIPDHICDLLKTPLSLAVWFMDDGNGYLKNSAFRISTYGFGLEGNLLLKNCFKKNFGLDVSVFRDSKGWQIYVPIRNGSANRFKFLIQPYILPSMTYKIESRSPVETYMEGTG